MLPFHTLDVFTDRPFAGNPLAVVLEAGGLTTRQMQTLAREFNLSETIFVQPAQGTGEDARVRIFLPAAEIPFAGHPAIGCAILLATLAAAPGDFTRALTLGTAAGPVPVTVTRAGGRVTAELTAPVIPHPHAGTADPALIAAATGLQPAEIGFGGHRPGLFAGGPAFLYVPVADLAALAAAAPRAPHWSALMAAGGVQAAYLYTLGGEADFRARMFSPTAGVPEDPATGSAACILAAQLAACGALPPGTARFTIRQGVEMGRPSDLVLTVVSGDTGILSVRLMGSAVRIAEGRIAVPPEE
jgi:trans-2,3-dihydro-3-hydroxyanthranilate isomerase